MTARMLSLSLAMLLARAVVLPAQESASDSPAGEPAQPTQTASMSPLPVLRTVAVLGYEVKWVDDPAEQKDLGQMLAVLVSDRLSAMDEVVIVERTEIEKVLAEQKLNLTGLVDESNRVRIGRLLGARFLLWGRGFKMGDEIYITTKVINAETGQFKGVIVELPAASAVSDILVGVCNELAAKLPTRVKALSPDQGPELSPVEMLKRRIGNARKSWLIAADEEHRRTQPVAVIDPAIRNELEHLLSGANQKVKSLGTQDARAVIEGTKTLRSFDPEVSCDYYVVAEGFSEFAQRLSGDLVVCTARVEIKVLDAKTNEVAAAGSLERRATDLSEHLAAKQALRKATRQVFLDLSQKLFGGTAEKPTAE